VWRKVGSVIPLASSPRGFLFRSYTWESQALSEEGLQHRSLLFKEIVLPTKEEVTGVLSVRLV